MAPEVFRWVAVFGILLVLTWIGFLILAVQWALNNAVELFGVVALLIGLFVVWGEYRRR